MCLYNNIWSFSGLGGLISSSLEAPGLHDTNFTTLSIASKPPVAKNWLDILKKSSKSLLLMKRVLNSMRNPKLAHILLMFYLSSLGYFIYCIFTILTVVLIKYYAMCLCVLYQFVLYNINLNCFINV